MSYDLYLAPRRGNFNAAHFTAYFSGRPHYTVEGAQAAYQNEDTGVYFVFEYNERDADTPPDEPYLPVALNINYFRPSFFILEAEPEVTAFVRAFDCAVSDPQIRGMGDGDYDAEKLAAGWNYGNEFAYQAILGQNPGHSIYTLPAATLARLWAWNRDREALQDRLGDARFVPKAMLLLADGRLKPVATWPDGIPIAVPPVEHFFVVRDALAPKRWFRKDTRPALVERRAVAALFNKHRDARYADVHVLGYHTPPDDVARLVRGLPANTAELAGIANDQVLDRELVEKFRPG